MLIWKPLKCQRPISSYLLIDFWMRNQMRWDLKAQYWKDLLTTESYWSFCVWKQGGGYWWTTTSFLRKSSRWGRKPLLPGLSRRRILILMITGLRWWCSGWESACKCRGWRFHPCQAGSHMQESNLAQAPQLWMLCSRGWERKRLKPACPELGLCNKKPLQGSVGPPLPTLQLKKARSKQPEPSAVKNQHMTVTSKSQSAPMLCTNVLEGPIITVEPQTAEQSTVT